jgi:3-oxoacyl-[acyl-carrier protein] reductase
MDLGVKGKVAIITGATHGIGRAAAERLAAEGAKVALVARTQADLDAAAEALCASTGGEAIGVAADVRAEGSVLAMVQKVADRWGRIDILVNNAGTSSASSFEEMTDAQVLEDFQLKVMGAIYCTRHALPFLKQNRGVICNTTTPGGKAPGAGSQPTALSRASGISLTKAWSKEFAADGIRVNTVCVGLLKSRQHERRWETAREKHPELTLDEHYARMGRHVPLQRVGEAQEAGDVIAFLCSDLASYVTGTAINVDGGASPVV